MKRDTSDWLTKKQASEFLGVSEKTIERLAQQHQLAPVERKRSDNRRELAYNPAELERIKGERDAPVNAVVVNEKSKSLARTVPRADGEILGNLVAALSAPRLALTDKLMLTEKEAAELAGMPRSFIRRMRKDGRLFAIRERGWRIRKSDLVKLIDSLDT